MESARFTWNDETNWSSQVDIDKFKLATSPRSLTNAKRWTKKINDFKNIEFGSMTVDNTWT